MTHAIAVAGDGSSSASPPTPADRRRGDPLQRFDATTCQSFGPRDCVR